MKIEVTKIVLLKGHGFSRAAHSDRRIWALVVHRLRRPARDETGFLQLFFVLLNLYFCFLLAPGLKARSILRPNFVGLKPHAPSVKPLRSFSALPGELL